MIDKDGIERPDKFDEHMSEIVNQKRLVTFDDTYPYRPRNIFFRAWGAFFRAIAIAFFNPYMAIRYHMRTFGNGQKKLKKQGFVITCNHVHLLDDLSIGTNVLCWRKIYFTTLDANIRRPCVGFFLRSLGGIPIPVESLSGMKKFNEDVSALLAKNKPVLYNPEGALWPLYREVRPFKKGAFSMAAKNDVPVLPIAVLFKRKKKRNGKFVYKLYFAICDPVFENKNLSTFHERVADLTDRVFETTRRVVDQWYQIQDCGFDGDEQKQKLRPKKDLTLEHDTWVVKELKKAKKSK